VDAGELEVLAAAARGDVDDPRALLDRDLVPRDHPVLDLAPGRGRRTARGSAADELLAADALAKRSSGYRATATHSPFSRRPYSASGLTAAATFAGSVHGVVVQTTSDSPAGRAAGSGRRATGRSAPGRRPPG
jgi:hypothetical protein